MTEPLATPLAAALTASLAAVGPWALALSLLAGGLIGAAFFGGLWWTTRRAAAAAQPALWVMGSLLLRMGGALAGFHLVGGGQWPRLLACLLGFVLARLLVLRFTRAAPKPAALAAVAPVVAVVSEAKGTDPRQLVQEGRHAPEPR